MHMYFHVPIHLGTCTSVHVHLWILYTHLYVQRNVSKRVCLNGNGKTVFARFEMVRSVLAPDQPFVYQSVSSLA